MSQLSRRAALFGGSTAAFIGLAGASPADAAEVAGRGGRRHPKPQPTPTPEPCVDPHGTPKYCSPTNSRAGETITVPAPGEARFGIHFDSPDQLARYTRYDYLTRHNPLLLGHRAGYVPDGPWPESGLESAQNVLATAPSTMIEIDLRMTADGKCVSMHDDTIDRETTGTGKLIELQSSYVLQQHLVNNLGQTTQHRTREVWEFFEWGVPAGALMWLDVKNATPQFVVDLIRQYKAESQVIVSAYGLANLRAYMTLAPELVYFVPTNPSLELETIREIRREGKIDRIIGFADYYVPNLQDSLTMHKWGAPMQLELNRYDQDLPAANLDDRMYTRAVAAGFRVLCTNQYAKVAEILGVTEWAPKP